MSTQQPVLELKNVDIGYNDALVNNVIARVLPGEIIAVLGPSGIGKTTLIRTIAGLVEPLQGEVTLHTKNKGWTGIHSSTTWFGSTCECTTQCCSWSKSKYFLFKNHV